MIIIIIIIIIIKAIYSQSGLNYLLILSQRYEEKPYFTDEPSVSLSCLGLVAMKRALFCRCYLLVMGTHTQTK